MRKLLLFLYSFFYLSHSFAQVHKADFSVMTYNLKYDDKNDAVNGWNNRSELVIGLLKYHQPAIFGTQEGLYNQLEDIDNALSNYAYLGVAREDGKKSGEFSAIFYDSTLFNLERSGDFWLSETPEKPSKGWDAAYTRICSWAEFQSKESGKVFFVFNAHFDNVGEIARANSASLILEKISALAKDIPVLLMGDLNFTPEAPPYKILSNVFQDSRLVSQSTPYGPKATFNGFHFTELPENRIDYVFASEAFKVLSYATLSDSYEMRYPSDHFPVIIQVKL